MSDKVKALLWFVIFVAFMGWTISQLHGQNFTSNEWQRLIMESEARQSAHAEQVRQAIAEYNESERIHKMSQLTAEINDINIQLNHLIAQKWDLRQQNLTSEKVELAIKKLAKQLKEKTDSVYKLSK